MSDVERREDLWLLGVLEAVLSLGDSSPRPGDSLGGEVDSNSSARIGPLRSLKRAASEARIDLGDDEQSVLRLLRRHLGPDIEFATPHRRVHRWLVAGREVLLDTLNGRRTCLRITGPAPARVSSALTRS